MIQTLNISADMNTSVINTHATNISGPEELCALLTSVMARIIVSAGLPAERMVQNLQKSIEFHEVAMTDTEVTFSAK